MESVRLVSGFGYIADVLNKHQQTGFFFYGRGRIKERICCYIELSPLSDGLFVYFQ